MAILAPDSSSHAEKIIKPKDVINFPIENFKLSKKKSLVPEIEFVDRKGAKKTLNDFRGKVILINFWATWCAPCIREMPSLERLHTKLSSTGFSVIALSEDHKGFSRITPFLKKIKIYELPVFHDVGSKIMFSLEAKVLPTTILIDRKGKEIGRFIGPAEWDSQEVVSLINFYIQKNKH